MKSPQNVSLFGSQHYKLEGHCCATTTSTLTYGANKNLIFEFGGLKNKVKFALTKNKCCMKGEKWIELTSTGRTPASSHL